MFQRIAYLLLVTAAALVVSGSDAQEKVPVEPAPLPKLPPPPAATEVAAKVNGQPIPEMSVYRVFASSRPKDVEKFRKDTLDYLIDNLLIEQYLTQLKVAVEDKEANEALAKIQEEVKSKKKDWDVFLREMFLTETDLRKELVATLRWDKFVLLQGTDKVLKDLFDKQPAMFDGSQIQARHILLGASAKEQEAASAKAAALKKQLADSVNTELGKLPAGTDNLAREKERIKLLDKAFADLAAKESTCPSKAQGGDLGWFPRVGAMVEPFARAAFALKPYEVSDPVSSEFGVHLILAVDQRPGKQQKYEDVKPFVMEVYGERLREAVLQMYKPRSKIEILPVK